MTKFWFPTPETCQIPDNLPSLQRKIFDNIADLQKRDHLDPQNNEHDKMLMQRSRKKMSTPCPCSSVAYCGKITGYYFEMMTGKNLPAAKGCKSSTTMAG